MKTKLQFGLGLLAFIGAAAAAVLVLPHLHPAVLDSQGPIAGRQRSLIITATLLMLIVVVPVFVLTFAIAWRYRATNTKATYQPDWDHNRLLEGAWWAIPFVIIAVLSVITWQSSHELDPFKPLSSAQPLKVQVVALQWKWLFLYPEQGMATVNFAQIPAGQPVDFQITSDAPMNSFWVPQLGGQIYAMSGMSTHLHLQADNPGDFAGSSANISGAGFSGMRFTVRAGSQADFNQWVKQVKASPDTLTADKYHELAEPSEAHGTIYYASAPADLYDEIVMQYMQPSRERTEH